MKIFCIGRNYAEHAKELNNEVPDNPVVFMKPPSALLLENKPFYYPDFSTNIHFELEIVLKIAKNGKRIQPKFAASYIEAISLGIDFTARDLQKKCKSKGWPWEIAKGFDHSAVLGPWVPFPENYKEGISFRLEKNGIPVQIGNTRNMLFSFEDILVYLSRYFKIQTGDIIYTGTPAGVGPIEIGDVLTGYLEHQLLISCEIK